MSNKCVECGTVMSLMPTDVQAGWKDYKLVIKGANAYVCPKCGHRAFDFADVKMMQELSQALATVPTPPEILNVEEAASLLRVSEQTVYNQIRAGKIPATKVGREWRISRSAVLSMIQGSTATDDSDSGLEQEYMVAARGAGQLSDNDKEVIRKYMRMAGRE